MESEVLGRPVAPAAGDVLRAYGAAGDAGTGRCRLDDGTDATAF